MNVLSCFHECFDVETWETNLESPNINTFFRHYLPHCQYYERVAQVLAVLNENKDAYPIIMTYDDHTGYFTTASWTRTAITQKQYILQDIEYRKYVEAMKNGDKDYNEQEYQIAKALNVLAIINSRWLYELNTDYNNVNEIAPFFIAGNCMTEMITPLMIFYQNPDDFRSIIDELVKRNLITDKDVHDACDEMLDIFQDDITVDVDHALDHPFNWFKQYYRCELPEQATRLEELLYKIATDNSHSDSILLKCSVLLECIRA